MLVELGYAIVKGIVQGLTEFLPISSTAHLVFMDVLDSWFHLQSVQPSRLEKEFFNVVVQLGTLGAVLFYFRQELLIVWNTSVQMLRSRLIDKKPLDVTSGPVLDGIPLGPLPLLLAFSVFCTGIFVILINKGSEPVLQALGLYQAGKVEDLSDWIFQTPQWVAVDLMLTGVLLWVSQNALEKRGQREKIEAFPVVSIWHAGWIGLSQGISAIFHGFSRSGTTISAGLFSGLDRTTATRYSFLLSIPTFILATIVEVLKLAKHGQIENFNWLSLIAAMIVASVVGYYCVKLFVTYVAKHSLKGFAIYCWVVGGILFICLTLHPIPLSH
ncbi:MAG: undecaprenyl-diphosphate phosphatase [Vampirovibrionales bacterium]|nr:undecaprenyl-diphosphate phosphatase [Vampirovibrionales bacterium]